MPRPPRLPSARHSFAWAVLPAQLPHSTRRPTDSSSTAPAVTLAGPNLPPPPFGRDSLLACRSTPSPLLPPSATRESRNTLSVNRLWHILAPPSFCHTPVGSPQIPSGTPFAISPPGGLSPPRVKEISRENHAAQTLTTRQRQRPAQQCRLGLAPGCPVHLSAARHQRPRRKLRRRRR